MNTREHFSVLGYNQIPFIINSRWYSKQADIPTFHFEELLGTKLRALYQRKKGRDIFDLWYAYDRLKPDTSKIISCFHKYLEFQGVSISRKEFEENLSNKMNDPNFRNDITPLIRPGINWNMDDAYQLVIQNIIEKLS